MLIYSYSANCQEIKIEGNFKNDKIYHFIVKSNEYDSNIEGSDEYIKVKDISVSFTNIDSGFISVWKYNDIYMTNKVGQVLHSKNGELELNILKGIEVKLFIDSSQGAIKLLNYDEIIEQKIIGERNFYAILNPSIDSAMDIDLINDVIAEYFSTPELLLSNEFHEIELYFGLYSRIFTKGIDIKTESTYKNPFGGEDFPIVGKIGIISNKRDVLNIQKVEEENREEANRIIYEMLQKMKKPGSSPIKKDRIPTFSLHNTTDYYYDVDSKLINKVTEDYNVKALSTTKTRTFYIKLLMK